MTVVPSGWHAVPLAEVLEHSIGGAWGSTPGQDEVDVRVIRVTELKKHGLLEPSTAALRSINNRQLRTRQLRPGDLLLEKSGGGPKTPVGRVGLVRVVEGPTVCANFMQLMRPNPTLVSARFVHLFLNVDFRTLELVTAPS
jgi:type I restriction enzyme S subunit